MRVHIDSLPPTLDPHFHQKKTMGKICNAFTATSTAQRRPPSIDKPRQQQRLRQQKLRQGLRKRARKNNANWRRDEVARLAEEQAQQAVRLAQQAARKELAMRDGFSDPDEIEWLMQWDEWAAEDEWAAAAESAILLDEQDEGATFRSNCGLTLDELAEDESDESDYGSYGSYGSYSPRSPRMCILCNE